MLRVDTLSSAPDHGTILPTTVHHAYTSIPTYTSTTSSTSSTPRGGTHVISHTHNDISGSHNTDVNVAVNDMTSSSSLSLFSTQPLSPTGGLSHQLHNVSISRSPPTATSSSYHHAVNSPLSPTHAHTHQYPYPYHQYETQIASASKYVSLSSRASYGSTVNGNVNGATISTPILQQSSTPKPYTSGRKNKSALRNTIDHITSSSLPISRFNLNEDDENSNVLTSSLKSHSATNTPGQQNRRLIDGNINGNSQIDASCNIVQASLKRST
jgi:hypothetical protein